MGRLMAIDFGLKRTGLAVTDDLKIIATPLTTVRTHQLWEFIKDYTTVEEIDAFIVGIPLNLDGSNTDVTTKAKQLVTKLSKAYPYIPCHCMDERFTSKIAKDAMLRGGMKKSERKKKENVDKIAATLILQGYMNTQN